MSIKRILLEQKEEQYSAEYIEDNFEHIGSGTEGEVYTDGKYSYKVVPSDNVAEPDQIIKSHKGKNYTNVVDIIDAWKDEEEGVTVIKMEKLMEIPLNKVKDREEFDRVREELWHTQDDQRNVLKMIKHIKDPEIIKMVKSIVNAADELNTSLDIGFHNLMYDPNTNEYKQIDIS